MKGIGDIVWHTDIQAHFVAPSLDQSLQWKMADFGDIGCDG